ncbi:ABC-F family ATP-binding cassette domain-containing protein [Pseudooceanicola sp. LIPI14-2-Ac024]|uniref:ABC-F family ATP-binding cassette domain-containing protein n=1 Tax=Pseudooceanicola sp. LIPI14-2-Ac024 TaxID=3344875 RepID=UPI0035CF43BC
MPASITLSNLSWSTPDGTPLFSDLDLTFGAERCGLVGRNGTGKTTLLRLIAGEVSPRAGSLHVDGRVGVLRQEVAPDPDATLADLFGARAALAVLDRAEAGCASIAELADADWLLADRIAAALARLGLDAAPATPLAALSGGQRTRARLAALIFDAPDILLLDEPTNNLDGAGRAAVAELLAGWTGGAIVVSHDRALLERMDAIVELTTLGATRYGGAYADYRARKAIELQAAEHDLARAERTRADTARKAQEAAERKARRDGAGKRRRAEGGQPKMLLDKAKERSEASGGANARLRDARRAEAEAAHDAARARIEVLQPMAMDLPPTGLHSARGVLRLDHLTGGQDAAAPVIRDLSLSLTGPERLAITGPNGAGKSTLLALLTGELPPLSGTAETLVPMARLDQQMDLLDPEDTILGNYRRLTPRSGETESHAALARFMFRAGDGLRRVGALSGGQRLRAGLACVLGRVDPPQLLILDEPTNHLDLDAMSALEAALNAYDGALIVVSHDTAFLDAIGITRRLHLPLAESAQHVTKL